MDEPIDDRQGEDPAPDHPGEGAAPDHPGGRPAKLVGMGLLAALVVLLDQATKIWAVERLTGADPIRVIDGVLQLRLVRNPGAAFSFGTDATWVFTIISVTVATVVCFVARRLGSRWWMVAFGLLLGGAVGNLVDRLFREPGVARGHVVDFLELPHWPVFNVADSCVVTGAIMIGLAMVRGVGVDGRRIPL